MTTYQMGDEGSNIVLRARVTNVSEKCDVISSVTQSAL